MEIIDIISNLGFPVACVIGLGWYIKDQAKRMEVATAAREKQYIDVINKQEKLILKMNDTNSEYVETLKGLTVHVEDIKNDVDAIKDVINMNKQKEGE